MISILVLMFSLLLIIIITSAILRSIIKKQPIIGRPPIPVFLFILAKMLVIVNLVFLLLKGLNTPVPRIFPPIVIIDIIALVLLIAGTVLLIFSTVRLNKDLVFGLSVAEDHKLHTKGVYSVSRHPFYLGFIFILFSSCLFNPHYLNLLAFLGAWVIHHFIMIREEQHLMARYGEEYRQYVKRVKRYISF